MGGVYKVTGSNHNNYSDTGKNGRCLALLVGNGSV